MYAILFSILFISALTRGTRQAKHLFAPTTPISRKPARSSSVASSFLLACSAVSAARRSFWATPMLPSRYRLPKRVLGLPQSESCARKLRRWLAEAHFDNAPLQFAISIDRHRGPFAGLRLPVQLRSNSHPCDRSDGAAHFLRHDDLGAL